MKENKDFLYILRFCVQPGHHEEERLKELVSFCEKGLINDVMFFIDCEDINQGHITKEEVKSWMKLIERAGKMLEPMGITTSINPWITLNHADRGRKLKEGQNFQLMVDPYGNQTSATACPLCKEWRNYITDMYSIYSSINPYMIWVEDDFRFHNHAPLKWGGCFCDIHMELYSKRAGKKLSREEFVRGILKPGEPHPYREIWLDTARETMMELAAQIGKAVHKVSPDTRLGLMSSIPEVHCAEGRNWEGILKGLACSAPMVNRPHLPSYQEVSPQSYFWYFNTISLLSKAMVPKETEIYPEVENSPRTLFAKSRTFTRFQIEASAALGSKGITLNLFNVMGSGILMEEGFQNMLRDAKPLLNSLTGLGIDRGTQKGVKVLYDPLSSYTLHTSHGEKMQELYPVENFWAGLLSSYGIANCYSSRKDHKNEVIAVSGQYFRNLCEKEIRHLFEKNFVLMDGTAAFTLFDMGFGGAAGISTIEWVKPFDGYHAYEEVCNGERYCGVGEARMSLQRAAGGYYKIEYGRKPYLITEAKSPDNKVMGPGMSIVDDRVFILPCGGEDTFFQIHLNSYKQAIVKWVINNIQGMEKPVYVEKEPYIGVYDYDIEDRRVILTVNASGDSLNEVDIHIPGYEAGKVYEVSRSRNGAEVKDICKGNETIISTKLERFEVKAFVLIK